MKNLTSLAHVGSDGSSIPWDLQDTDPNRSDTGPSSQPEPGAFDNQVRRGLDNIIVITK